MYISIALSDDILNLPDTLNYLTLNSIVRDLITRNIWVFTESLF